MLSSNQKFPPMFRTDLKNEDLRNMGGNLKLEPDIPTHVPDRLEKGRPPEHGWEFEPRARHSHQDIKKLGEAKGKKHLSFPQLSPAFPSFPQVSQHFPQLFPAFPSFPQLSPSSPQFPPAFLGFPWHSPAFLSFTQLSAAFPKVP